MATLASLNRDRFGRPLVEPDAGGPPPVWGSPEWNAASDPRHAQDVAYINSSAYANDLNRVNPGLVGEGNYFHYDPTDTQGTSLHNANENDSNWVNLYRPAAEFYGSAIGGAALGGLFSGAGEAGAGEGLAGGIGEGSASTAATGVAPAATAGIGGGDTGIMAGAAASGAGGLDEAAMMQAARTQSLNSLAAQGITGGTGASGAGTALSRILDGTATTSDWLSAGGNLGSTVLGVAGSRNQANAYRDLQNRYMALGAPSRSRYEASMTPGFDPNSIPGYSGAVDTASKGILARLAATGGNPWGNPGGLIEANKQIISGTALPAIQNYQNQNAATGGFGAFNTAAPAAANAGIGANAGVYNAIGSGLAGLTNPQPSIYDTLARLGVQGLS